MNQPTPLDADFFDPTLHLYHFFSRNFSKKQKIFQGALARAQKSCTQSPETVIYPENLKFCTPTHPFHCHPRRLRPRDLTKSCTQYRRSVLGVQFYQGSLVASQRYRSQIQPEYRYYYLQYYPMGRETSNLPHIRQWTYQYTSSFGNMAKYTNIPHASRSTVKNTNIPRTYT